METSEEEFAKFLQIFVADVWGLLMKVSLKPGQVIEAEKCAGMIQTSVIYKQLGKQKCGTCIHNCAPCHVPMFCLLHAPRAMCPCLCLIHALLGPCAACSPQDNLVMAAIRFLTTVSRSVHYTLFAAPGVLQQICEMVIVPNVRSRPEDEEVRGLVA